VKDTLRQRFDAVREGTLQLLDLVADGAFDSQPDPDFSPIGWHVGHVATFEHYWLLEQCRGDPPLPDEYRRLFSPLETPKSLRRALPSRTEIMEMLGDVRARVLRYLESGRADPSRGLPDDERIFRNVIQHELQHSETMSLVLHMHDRPERPEQTPLLAPGEAGDTPMVRVPAGSFLMGRDPIGDTYDNEGPPHRVDLEEFFIDVHPVTNAQFLGFLSSGGYDERRCWGDDGWAWRCRHNVRAPRYWLARGDGWLARGFFGDGALRPDHPVQSLSWYEAEAYARWCGKRLPSEAEWEKAAAWDMSASRSLAYAWGDQPPDSSRCNFERAFDGTTAVGSFGSARSPSGCFDMNGNVWEWTATAFAPYPKFVPYPYEGYSQPYFDGQHRVLRGGSWATRGSIVRNTFRNWYAPATRVLFAGFRCTRDADG
jgi:iron(II)-dependent oxidoreductase